MPDMLRSEVNWRVPRLWPGATVAIFASGPSMTQGVADQVRDAGVPAIVVNSTFRLAPWAALLYAADADWWQHPDNADAHEFSGLKVSVSSVRGVLKLRETGTNGFDPDPTSLRTGRNSGYQALHIAMHTGPERILLCGFDMTRRDGAHWHGEHPKGLRKTHEDEYVGWRAGFEALIPALHLRSIEVVNCSPKSALECFPRNLLEAELATCTQSAAV